MIMEDAEAIDLVEEATLDFSLGDEDVALERLGRVLEHAPGCFEAWRASAEVGLATGDSAGALSACERAVELRSEEVTAWITLSRVLVAMGDKEGAETAAAKARILGWKEELREDEGGE